MSFAQNNAPLVKQFTAIMARVKTRQDALQRDIQVLAVSCIGWAILDGNVGTASQVYDALTKCVNRGKFKTFLEVHAPVVYDAKQKKFMFDARRDTMRTFDPKALLATDWTAATKDKEVKDVDVLAMFDKIVKAVESADKAGVAVHGREYLESMIKARNALTVELAAARNESEGNVTAIGAALEKAA